jgi:hypothetical protein
MLLIAVFLGLIVFLLGLVAVLLWLELCVS